MSGVRRVTLRDVAMSAGVSATTVSHALSGKGRVDPDTRAHIQALARDMGYKPNSAARALRTGHSHTIALVSSVSAGETGLDEEVSYLTNLAVAAAQESLTSGYALVLLPPLDQESFLDSVSVDGVIHVFPRADDWLLRATQRHGIPSVTVGRDVRRRGIPGVQEDSPAIAALALDHLTERGCRRPALLLTTAVYAIDANIRLAYEKWSANRGTALQIFEVPSGDAEKAGYELARQLLDGEESFDGIFAPLDAMASGFARGARSRGRRLPRDLRIVTTEGGWARHGATPLTAVDFHPESLVRQAVRMLIGRLSGEEMPRIEPAPPQLLVRSTT